ncbi:PREDICTED: uncharacterized protein LOC105462607 [Wasmannia auropunctata]|uniref:uncharacterized protein LOC105462607 n=1 Tax=Wasmannia auropunctata TaxID=64793 RepID=UPI0005EF8F9B|nr:PREDICTED: uncharacterized protein LOC105462607 [Wasmannia auropunctata]
MFSFADVLRRRHLLPSSGPPLCFSATYGALLYCPDVNLDDGCKIGKRSKDADSKFQRIFRDELKSAMCVYTDGSRTNGCPFAGFAFTAHDESISCKFRSVGFVSSFCVEAMAVLAALNLAESQEWPRLVIFSDSKSVLSAVGAPYVHSHSSYLVLKIKASVYRLVKERGAEVKLVWIPSHTGIRGNERADVLASEAVRDGRDTQFGIPTSEFTNLWSASMYDDLWNWSKKEAATRGALYCNNYLIKSKQVWFKKFDIKRRTVTTINRIRSGHTSLRASLFRHRIVDSPLCLSCGLEESPNHVFWECTDYSVQRNALEEALVRERGFLPHPVEYLMATLEEDIIYPLNSFICSIDKFI